MLSPNGSQIVVENEIGSYVIDLTKGVPATNATLLPAGPNNSRFTAILGRRMESNWQVF